MHEVLKMKKGGRSFVRYEPLKMKSRGSFEIGTKALENFFFFVGMMDLIMGELKGQGKWR